MNKFMKYCAITALVLLVGGFVISYVAGSVKVKVVVRNIISSVMNGDYKEMWNDVEAWGASMLNEIETPMEYSLEDVTIFDGDYEIYSGEQIKEFTIDEVRELKTEVGGCNFTIKESQDSMVRIETERIGKFQSYVKDDILYLRASVADVVGTTPGGDLTLYVPEGFVFDKVTMELGAGTMEVSNVTADRIQLEIGAGRMEAGQLTADRVTVEVGVGEAVIHDMVTDKLEAEVGMGNMEVTGEVSGKAELSCAMGNITMKLAGSKADYDYKLECGMGNISIGNDAYSGLTKEMEIDNDALSKIEAECAVGNISLNFAE